MDAEWASVSLKEVLTERRVRHPVEPEKGYPVAGVLGFGRGMLLRPAVRGADMSAKYLYRIEQGQLVYSRLKAFEGAFALVTPDADGRFVSNEFPTFDVDKSRAEPAYVALLLSQPRIWQELQAGSEGMGARRERLQPPDFLDLVVDLPPLYEQRRIVAAMSTVESCLAAHMDKAVASWRAHRVAREDLIESREYERVPLDEVVVSVKGGKSPQCLNRPPAGDEFGVLKVSAIRDGLFRSGEAKALPPGIAPAADSVHEGDLLYSRANTSSLVGAMCRAPQDYPTLLLCDKTMRVEVDRQAIDPDYLVEAVGTSVARDHIEMHAGGTSESMKNISQEAFLATEVAIPTLAEQGRIAGMLLALRRAAMATESAARAVAQLRASLGDDFVSGLVEVATTTAEA